MSGINRPRSKLLSEKGHLCFLFLDFPSVTTPGTVTINESESKILTCTASGNPTPAVSDYKWIHPDGTITKSKQLEIRGATKDDTGRYRCQVSVRSEVYGLLNGTSNTMVTVQCKFKIQKYVEYK